MGAKREQHTAPMLSKPYLPTLPKRLLSVHRTISIPTCSPQVSEDTVMAVVADSHRSFLIPEQYRLAVCPTTNFPFENSDELCYSFHVEILYHKTLGNAIVFLKKAKAVIYLHIMLIFIEFDVNMYQLYIHMLLSLTDIIQ